MLEQDKVAIKIHEHEIINFINRISKKDITFNESSEDDLAHAVYEARCLLNLVTYLEAYILNCNNKDRSAECYEELYDCFVPHDRNREEFRVDEDIAEAKKQLTIWKSFAKRFLESIFAKGRRLKTRNRTLQDLLEQPLFLAVPAIRYVLSQISNVSEFYPPERMAEHFKSAYGLYSQTNTNQQVCKEFFNLLNGDFLNINVPAEAATVPNVKANKVRSYAGSNLVAKRISAKYREETKVEDQSATTNNLSANEKISFIRKPRFIFPPSWNHHDAENISLGKVIHKALESAKSFEDKLYIFTEFAIYLLYATPEEFNVFFDEKRTEIEWKKSIASFLASAFAEQVCAEIASCNNKNELTSFQFRFSRLLKYFVLNNKYLTDEQKQIIEQSILQAQDSKFESLKIKELPKPELAAVAYNNPGVIDIAASAGNEQEAEYMLKVEICIKPGSNSASASDIKINLPLLKFKEESALKNFEDEQALMEYIGVSRADRINKQLKKKCYGIQVKKETNSEFNFYINKVRVLHEQSAENTGDISSTLMPDDESGYELYKGKEKFRQFIPVQIDGQIQRPVKGLFETGAQPAQILQRILESNKIIYQDKQVALAILQNKKIIGYVYQGIMNLKEGVSLDKIHNLNYGIFAFSKSYDLTTWAQCIFQENVRSGNQRHNNLGDFEKQFLIPLTRISEDNTHKQTSIPVNNVKTGGAPIDLFKQIKITLKDSDYPVLICHQDQKIVGLITENEIIGAVSSFGSMKELLASEQYYCLVYSNSQKKQEYISEISKKLKSTSDQPKDTASATNSIQPEDRSKPAQTDNLNLGTPALSPNSIQGLAANKDKVPSSPYLPNREKTVEKHNSDNSLKKIDEAIKAIKELPEKESVDTGRIAKILKDVSGALRLMVDQHSNSIDQNLEQKVNTFLLLLQPLLVQLTALDTELIDFARSLLKFANLILVRSEKGIIRDSIDTAESLSCLVRQICFLMNPVTEMTKKFSNGNGSGAKRENTINSTRREEIFNSSEQKTFSEILIKYVEKATGNPLNAAYKLFVGAIATDLDRAQWIDGKLREKINTYSKTSSDGSSSAYDLDDYQSNFEQYISSHIIEENGARQKRMSVSNRAAANSFKGNEILIELQVTVDHLGQIIFSYDAIILELKRKDENQRKAFLQWYSNKLLDKLDIFLSKCFYIQSSQSAELIKIIDLYLKILAKLAGFNEISQYKLETRANKEQELGIVRFFLHFILKLDATSDLRENKETIIEQLNFFASQKLLLPSSGTNVSKIYELLQAKLNRYLKQICNCNNGMAQHYDLLLKIADSPLFANKDREIARRLVVEARAEQIIVTSLLCLQQISNEQQFSQVADSIAKALQDISVNLLLNLASPYSQNLKNQFETQLLTIFNHAVKGLITNEPFSIESAEKCILLLQKAQSIFEKNEISNLIEKLSALILVYKISSAVSDISMADLDRVEYLVKLEQPLALLTIEQAKLLAKLRATQPELLIQFTNELISAVEAALSKLSLQDIANTPNLVMSCCRIMASIKLLAQFCNSNVQEKVARLFAGVLINAIEKTRNLSLLEQIDALQTIARLITSSSLPIEELFPAVDYLLNSLLALVEAGLSKLHPIHDSELVKQYFQILSDIEPLAHSSKLMISGLKKHTKDILVIVNILAYLRKLKKASAVQGRAFSIPKLIEKLRYINSANLDLRLVTILQEELKNFLSAIIPYLSNTDNMDDITFYFAQLQVMAVLPIFSENQQEDIKNQAKLILVRFFKLLAAKNIVERNEIVQKLPRETRTQIAIFVMHDLSNIKDCSFNPNKKFSSQVREFLLLIDPNCLLGGQDVALALQASLLADLFDAIKDSTAESMDAFCSELNQSTHIYSLEQKFTGLLNRLKELGVISTKEFDSAKTNFNRYLQSDAGLTSPSEAATLAITQFANVDAKWETTLVPYILELITEDKVKLDKYNNEIKAFPRSLITNRNRPDQVGRAKTLLEQYHRGEKPLILLVSELEKIASEIKDKKSKLRDILVGCIKSLRTAVLVQLQGVFKAEDYETLSKISNDASFAGINELLNLQTDSTLYRKFVIANELAIPLQNKSFSFVAKYLCQICKQVGSSQYANVDFSEVVNSIVGYFLYYYEKEQNPDVLANILYSGLFEGLAQLVNIPSLRVRARLLERLQNLSIRILQACENDFASLVNNYCQGSNFNEGSAKRLGKFFSGEFGTSLSIDGIKYKFPNSIQMQASTEKFLNFVKEKNNVIEDINQFDSFKKQAYLCCGDNIELTAEVSKLFNNQPKYQELKQKEFLQLLKAVVLNCDDENAVTNLLTLFEDGAFKRIYPHKQEAIKTGILLLIEQCSTTEEYEAIISSPWFLAVLSPNSNTCPDNIRLQIQGKLEHYFYAAMYEGKIPGDREILNIAWLSLPFASEVLAYYRKLIDDPKANISPETRVLLAKLINRINFWQKNLRDLTADLWKSGDFKLSVESAKRIIADELLKKSGTSGDPSKEDAIFNLLRQNKNMETCLGDVLLEECRKLLNSPERSKDFFAFLCKYPSLPASEAVVKVFYLDIVNNKQFAALTKVLPQPDYWSINYFQLCLLAGDHGHALNYAAHYYMALSNEDREAVFQKLLIAVQHGITINFNTALIGISETFSGEIKRKMPAFLLQELKLISLSKANIEAQLINLIERYAEDLPAFIKLLTDLRMYCSSPDQQQQIFAILQNLFNCLMSNSKQDNCLLVFITLLQGLDSTRTEFAALDPYTSVSPTQLYTVEEIRKLEAVLEFLANAKLETSQVYVSNLAKKLCIYLKDIVSSEAIEKNNKIEHLKLFINAVAKLPESPEKVFLNKLITTIIEPEQKTLTIVLKEFNESIRKYQEDKSLTVKELEKLIQNVWYVKFCCSTQSRIQFLQEIEQAIRELEKAGRLHSDSRKFQIALLQRLIKYLSIDDDLNSITIIQLLNDCKASFEVTREYIFAVVISQDSQKIQEMFAIVTESYDAQTKIYGGNPKTFLKAFVDQCIELIRAGYIIDFSQLFESQSNFAKELRKHVLKFIAVRLELLLKTTTAQKPIDAIFATLQRFGLGNLQVLQQMLNDVSVTSLTKEEEEALIIVANAICESVPTNYQKIRSSSASQTYHKGFLLSENKVIIDIKQLQLMIALADIFKKLENTVRTDNTQIQQMSENISNAERELVCKSLGILHKLAAHAAINTEISEINSEQIDIHNQLVQSAVTVMEYLGEGQISECAFLLQVLHACYPRIQNAQLKNLASYAMFLLNNMLANKKRLPEGIKQINNITELQEHASENQVPKPCVLAKDGFIIKECLHKAVVALIKHSKISSNLSESGFSNSKQLHKAFSELLLYMVENNIFSINDLFGYGVPVRIKKLAISLKELLTNKGGAFIALVDALETLALLTNKFSKAKYIEVLDSKWNEEMSGTKFSLQERWKKLVLLLKSMGVQLLSWEKIAEVVTNCSSFNLMQGVVPKIPSDGSQTSGSCPITYVSYILDPGTRCPPTNASSEDERQQDRLAFGYLDASYTLLSNEDKKTVHAQVFEEARRRHRTEKNAGVAGGICVVNPDQSLDITFAGDPVFLLVVKTKSGEQRVLYLIDPHNTRNHNEKMRVTKHTTVERSKIGDRGKVCYGACGYEMTRAIAGDNQPGMSHVPEHIRVENLVGVIKHQLGISEGQINSITVVVGTDGIISTYPPQAEGNLFKLDRDYFARGFMARNTDILSREAREGVARANIETYSIEDLPRLATGINSNKNFQGHVNVRTSEGIVENHPWKREADNIGILTLDIYNDGRPVNNYQPVVLCAFDGHGKHGEKIAEDVAIHIIPDMNKRLILRNSDKVSAVNHSEKSASATPASIASADAATPTTHVAAANINMTAVPPVCLGSPALVGSPQKLAGLGSSSTNNSPPSASSSTPGALSSEQTVTKGGATPSPSEPSPPQSPTSGKKDGLESPTKPVGSSSSVAGKLKPGPLNLNDVSVASPNPVSSPSVK